MLGAKSAYYLCLPQPTSPKYKEKNPYYPNVDPVELWMRNTSTWIVKDGGPRFKAITILAAETPDNNGDLP